MLTTDPKDPDLGRGADKEKTGQNKKYLVLSDEELAKGFVRPVRTKYVHVGHPGVKVCGKIREEYEPDENGNVASVCCTVHDDPNEKCWGFSLVKPAELAEIKKNGYWRGGGKGCGVQTVMAEKIAETYARNPSFYGATYCMGCQKHLPVKEFMWDDDSGERIGE